MSTKFHQRRKFFAENAFPGVDRVPCPCCGYPTIDERGSYEICELCRWEDDGQDDTDASEIRGGPNQDFSLTEARANFAKHLGMYSPARDTRIGGSDTEAVRKIKQELISVFDSMVLSSSVKPLSELWEKALIGKNAVPGNEEAQPTAAIEAAATSIQVLSGSTIRPESKFSAACRDNSFWGRSIRAPITTSIGIKKREVSSEA